MQVDKNWGNAYWIDVVRLCEGFISPQETLEKVIYFTASPIGTAKNARQSAFLNANRLSMVINLKLFAENILKSILFVRIAIMPYLVQKKRKQM